MRQSHSKIRIRKDSNDIYLFTQFAVYQPYLKNNSFLTKISYLLLVRDRTFAITHPSLSVSRGRKFYNDSDIDILQRLKKDYPGAK